MATAQFTAWSYSRLTDWEACPLRAKLKHIERRPEPSSPALERGSRLHQEIVLWFYKSIDWVRHLIDVGENPWNISPYKTDPYNPKRGISSKG